jgi:hypothetical protein
MLARASPVRALEIDSYQKRGIGLIEAKVRLTGADENIFVYPRS